MNEHFPGWRRKAGLITLGLACLCLCLWLRGQVIVDVVIFSSSASHRHVLSIDHFGYWWFSINQPSTPFAANYFTIPNRDLDASAPDFEFEPDLSYSLWGFHIALKYDSDDRHVIRETVWIVPHWFTLSPLTILSAYLLLVGPRSCAKPKSSLQ